MNKYLLFTKYLLRINLPNLNSYKGELVIGKTAKKRNLLFGSTKKGWSTEAPDMPGDRFKHQTSCEEKQETRDRRSLFSALLRLTGANPGKNSAKIITCKLPAPKLSTELEYLAEIDCQAPQDTITSFYKLLLIKLLNNLKILEIHLCRFWAFFIGQ